MEIRKLYQHQRNAVKRATEGNLALFHECGTGKTLTALKIIEHHKAMGCGPALVVCPLSIIEAAWMADAAKLSQLSSLYQDFMANYMGRVKADVAQEGTKAV